MKYLKECLAQSECYIGFGIVIVDLCYCYYDLKSS